nr:uncharacterized protein LOC105347200 isoform X2 [Crassostrea gigas]
MVEARILDQMWNKQMLKTQFCSAVLVIMTQTDAEDLGHNNPIERWVWFCRRSYMTLTLIIEFLRRRVIPLCMLIRFIELCTQEQLFTKMNQIEDVLGENSQARKNKPLPKKQMPVKKPPPESIRNIKRNMVFKILHPYDFD